MTVTRKILKNIEREIEKCKKQLKDLEPLIYQNAGIAENYNRILVKKAILVDKYKKLISKHNPVKKILNLLKFRKDSKLICDYFPNT